VKNVAEGLTKINGMEFATEQKAGPAASASPSATPSGTKTKP
jgi:hypothetical protein